MLQSTISRFKPRWTFGRRTMAAAALLLLVGSASTFAQQDVNVNVNVHVDLGNATHLVMPQTRAWDIRHPRRPVRESGVQIESVSANVSILDGTASTTLDIKLVNNGSQRAEAVLLLPVPDKAAVSNFMFEGAASEPTAEILRHDEARRIYDDIVRSLRDPALLEFAGYNLIRTSVFPVAAHGRQRIRLTYENILEGDGNRIDYVLPRSESLFVQVPWNITVDVQAKSPISMVYSPSHTIVEDERDARHIRLHVSDQSAKDPGAFRLSYLLEREDVTASMFAYPDPKVGGGYFLLMAGMPAKITDPQQQLKREVTLVLDRSGSMAGGKLDQVRAAALQIIEGLEPGEAFNIIDYSHTVSKFSKAAVIRSEKTVKQAREYLISLRPNGGTNIYDSLVESLRQEPRDDMLPLVLFLTDGLPTVGNTSEVAIRELVEKFNEHHRRVFTFGVGEDVNVPLLERLAEASRARPTFVLPDEDVELKVAQTFRRLYGPVLTDVELTTENSGGVEATTMVREMMPSIMPDVFEGDQIIVLGQYTSDKEPITFELTGNFLGKERMFRFTFDFDEATTRNAFVPRLWAARRIAYLVDQIRQAGAVVSATPVINPSIVNLPKYKELVDEIVRLSTEFGVLSEYTAFLAREGTNLNDWKQLVASCSTLIDDRAVKVRAGRAALNQGLNIVAAKLQGQLKYDNRYWNAQMESVVISNVQQVNDKCFFKRGNLWIDGSLIARQQRAQDVQQELVADRIVEFGSDEHLQMVYDLASQNRQGALSLPGDIYLDYNGETVLIRLDVPQ